MQKKIDTKLKQLQSMTYASDDSTVLQNLLTKLTDLEGEVVTALPKVDGLVLRPFSLRESSKRIKRKYQKMIQASSKYSRLPSAPIHRKSDKYLKRVGRKACSMRVRINFLLVIIINYRHR